MCDKTNIVKEAVILLLFYLVCEGSAFVVVGERFGNIGLKQNISTFDEIKDKNNIRELRVASPEELYLLDRGNISNFKSLEKFAIQGKIIRIAQGTFFNLPSIRNIEIYLVYVLKLEPKTFANLSVEVIVLRGNRLLYLEDDAFLNLPKLERVSLNENQISGWEPTAFRNTPNVKSLSLRLNYLRKLSDNAFDVFPKLANLDLTKNQLMQVGHFPRGLPQLRTLDMRQNELRMLPDNFFAPNHTFATPELQQYYQRSYEYIGLASNQLSYLPEKILNDISRTENLDIGWNPWNCECHYQILVWATKYHITLRQNNGNLLPVCITPSKKYSKRCQIIDDNEAIEHYWKNVPVRSLGDPYVGLNPEPNYPVQSENISANV